LIAACPIPEADPPLWAFDRPREIRVRKNRIEEARGPQCLQRLKNIGPMTGCAVSIDAASNPLDAVRIEIQKM